MRTGEGEGILKPMLRISCWSNARRSNPWVGKGFVTGSSFPEQPHWGHVSLLPVGKEGPRIVQKKPPRGSEANPWPVSSDAWHLLIPAEKEPS
jgi:hypothetical protein